MNKATDFIKLILVGLLVSLGLALGLHFVGLVFLKSVFLLALGFIMPYSRWKTDRRSAAIPKLYFLISGILGFLIFFALWRYHGDQGSSPITALDMAITIPVWAIADFQIRKKFGIKKVPR